MAEAKKEVKETKEVKVLVATYPSAHSDQAKKTLAKVEEAGVRGFEVKPAKDLPGYIQVAKICASKEEAEKALAEVKEKKINACLA